MSERLIDISVPIRSGMFVYPGNPGVSLTRELSISAGDGANVSRLSLGVHTGTHVDAPRHFDIAGGGAETIPPEALLGPAWVVDGTQLNNDIDAAALATLALPEGTRRLLFKTTNSELWAREEFSREFIRFLGSGADRLIELGVRLVGIDYLSIGDPDAHHAFLGAGVVVLEGLDLRGVTPGAYELHCTALKLVGSDGAPARALLSPTR